MNNKTTEWVALIGGVLSALLLFLRSIGIEALWFNEDTIGSFLNLLTTVIPLFFVFFGIYKNQYLITPKAKQQEEVLKKEGLK